MGFKRGTALLAIGAVILSVGLSFWAGPHFANVMADGAARLRGMRVFGWLIFITVEFFVTLVGIVPGALLGIAAGLIYGVWFGFIAGATGIMAGALVAFGLSRSMLRPWIGQFLWRWRRLAALDQAIAKDGWRIVALLRVSPIMPFSITSYVLGFSGITSRDYFVGTLASLPPLLGYVVIGALGNLGVSSRMSQGAEIHFLLLGLGIAATFALTLHLSRLMGRVLRTVA